MVVLGVLLLLIGVGGGVLAAVAARNGSGNVTVEALGFTHRAGVLEVAVYGAAVALVFCLGWALVAAAARRRGRAKREEREREHIATVERRARADKDELERRFEEAGRRDEDFTRREKELSARHDGLDSRERELDERDRGLAERDRQLADRVREQEQRELEWRERQPPTVADVVTGRATGSVADGTARWVRPGGSGTESGTESGGGRRGGDDTVVDGEPVGRGRDTSDDATQAMPRVGHSDPTEQIPRTGDRR